MNDYDLAFAKTGILPVINIPQIDVALPLAEALLAGGLDALEVTLRSNCSLEAIRRIKDTYPQMYLGAGTVLNVEMVDKAVQAGADFIVSPGYDEEVVDYCISRGILITPGCVSASEIQSAMKKGLKVLKFFPAELNGGIDAIQLLAGPFPDVKFIPTGGINFNNLGRYLRSEKIIACGGSYMATADQIKNRDFEGITNACKKAMNISLGFELAHVGVNNQNADEAIAFATMLGDIFCMPVKVGNSSTFVGTSVEFMHSQYFGKNGHIGFKTNSMIRALAYLKKNHIDVIEDSIRKDEQGKLVSAYLQKEIGNFAIHIVRK